MGISGKTADSFRFSMGGVSAGAWRGAKRGFLIVASVAVVIGAVCWSLVFLAFNPSSLKSGLKELTLFPVAVCMYGLVGAAIGALVMGTRASRRFKELQPVTPANSQQPQSPPSADQPSADGLFENQPLFRFAPSNLGESTEMDNPYQSPPKDTSRSTTVGRWRAFWRRSCYGSFCVAAIFILVLVGVEYAFGLDTSDTRGFLILRGLLALGILCSLTMAGIAGIGWTLSRRPPAMSQDR